MEMEVTRSEQRMANFLSTQVTITYAMLARVVGVEAARETVKQALREFEEGFDDHDDFVAKTREMAEDLERLAAWDTDGGEGRRGV